jgi:hypothetical protein
MRIISIEPAPVARVFALTYAVFGFAAFAAYAFSSLQFFIFPIGIIMGVFHLVFNLQLPRSHDLIANAFFCGGAILSYAASGWITGVALALCFNFIAQKTGGINVKFVSVDDDSPHDSR